MTTQSQWVDKIKSWVPSWFYKGKELETAYIFALAKVLSVLEEDIEDQVAQTFVGEAVGFYLSLQGAERGIEKFSDEYDVDFRKRVRAAAIKSNANKPSLATLLNKIVIRGQVFIKEDFEIGSFFNRSTFLNRGDISVEQIKDAFTIIVDKQIHEPYSFFDRGTFFGRTYIGGGFVGQSESSAKVFALLIKTTNENKAFGTLYRIVERT